MGACALNAPREGRDGREGRLREWNVDDAVGPAMVANSLLCETVLNTLVHPRPSTCSLRPDLADNLKMAFG